MRPSLTTLGAPSWDIQTIAERAAEYRYEGVDFRGYLDEIDVTRSPAFTDELDETARTFDEFGIETSAVSTSIELCDPDGRGAHVAEAERTMPVLNALDADYVRVFGGGDLDEHSRDELAEMAAETMDELLAVEGAGEVTWMVETHDHWIAAEDVRLLVDAIDEPNVGVLWDLGHTPRVGGEDPAETLDAIGDDVVYVHVKDAIYEPDHPEAMDDGWRYVTPGEGELPLAEGLDLLREREYDGWVLFEHEKRWHPELPEPEAIYPEFVRWFESL